MSETEVNPDRMYDEANQLKSEGNLEGAVELLLKVLETHPDHLQTNMALGVHLQKLGRPAEAVKYAKRVTEIEPNDPFSFTQLSVIYQRCGYIMEAETAMAQAHVLQGKPAHTGQPETSQHAEGKSDTAADGK